MALVDPPTANEALLNVLGLDLLVLFGALVANRLVRFVLHQTAERLRPGIRRAVVEAASRPAGFVVLALGFWFAGQLAIPRLEHLIGDEAQRTRFITYYEQVFTGIWWLFLAWFGTRLMDEMTAIWEAKAAQTEGTFDDQLVPIVRKTGKTLFVVVGLLMAADNVGFHVGSLLAGLGIGGAALALASKDTVANVFGSLVIFIDRPFQIGDWVEIGGVEGTVEEVGLRVTRIRTFSNSLITVPNAQLTTTAINNWSRMQKRRIKMTVGVTYDATPEQMAAAVEGIRDIIAGDERFDQSFSLVNFHEFGASSLDIFVYCFTRTTNWADYMEVRQDFLLAIMRLLKQLGMEAAFPTRTVHIASGGDADGAFTRQAPV